MHVRNLIASEPTNWLSILTEQYAISAVTDGDLVSLKYNQIESPMHEPNMESRVKNKNSTGDAVNHPPHYTRGKFEPIDVIEDWSLGFHLGNTVKYISRAGHKDPAKTLEDLRKAAWYLNREIERLSK